VTEPFHSAADQLARLKIEAPERFIANAEILKERAAGKIDHVRQLNGYRIERAPCPGPIGL
jgi:hypothetical protein